MRSRPFPPNRRSCRPLATLLLGALLLPALVVSSASAEHLADASEVESPMNTPWTDEVGPDNALPEYPRPQMVREDWLNLNGTWEWAPAQEGEEPPLDGELLVPYPVESALSGIREHHERMWYRQEVEVPEEWDDRRVRLNFGAVDWESTVWVNGTEVGTHTGGYDSFEYDITDALTDGANEIVVGVYDPTDSGGQPVGKQRLDPEAIFYTPYSGIWQTVWMEPVAETHATRLDVTPDVEDEEVEVLVHADGGEGATAHVSVRDGDGEAGSTRGVPGEPIRVPVPDPHLWSPDDPFLYDVDVVLRQDGETVDEVAGYTGMRSVTTGEVDGVERPLLNGEYVFQIGTLDQGYWPDGIATAPTDEALRFDLEAHKDLGYNTVRKHVKVEPDRWYYWADVLGLIVWQDMPNMPDDPSPEDQEQFETELHTMVDQHRSFPSITHWIPFNEGWGQYDGARITDEVQSSDPSRLVTGASGWYDTGNGDAVDSHIYVGPGDPAPAREDRISVLGEFGGYGVRIDGHEWSPGDGFGYEMLEDTDSLNHRYVGLMAGVQRLERTHGLSAAIYTEITDVENELNGMWTYDRQVLKADADVLSQAHRELVEGEPVGGSVDLPTEEPLSLRVTTPGHDDRYLVHEDGLGATAPVDDDSDESLKGNATWRFVPGLADDRCYSLESVDRPSQYLRHYESRVSAAEDDGSDLFAEDATWCGVPGQSGDGISLYSYNHPDKFLRHHDSELWLAGMGGTTADHDTAENYLEDVTWAPEAPWGP